LCERARGGTLFLDHLSVFGAETQAQLLSWLLGRAASTDIRVLGARDPGEALTSCLVPMGLALVEIPVPALRQRRSDIPILVDHFLQLYVARHAMSPRRIDTEAMVQLWQYDWPGNVRELESVIERVVVLSRSGVIRTADLPPHICRVGKKADAPRSNGNGCAVSIAALR
jgi:DNA-binding NtrC family response regulator